MPTICVFFGIVIQMHWRDHAPPHFHAIYGEYDATITIEDLRVLTGSLPSRAMAMVREWANEHQSDLVENWEGMQGTQDSKSIPSLEEIVPEPRPRSPWRVVSVRALPEWRLAVKFVDGTEGEVHMAEFIRSRIVLGTVFEPLRNPVFFAKVRVVLGVVTWPNGTDLAPDAMYDEIRKHGRWVL